MKNLAKVLTGIFLLSGMAMLLAACGGGNNGGGSNTAAVGTCASGQIMTSAGCGTVSAQCYGGTGGLVNGSCFPATTGVTAGVNGVCAAGQISTQYGCGTISSSCYGGAGGVVNGNCYPAVAGGSTNGYTWNGTSCVQASTNSIVPTTYCNTNNAMNGACYQSFSGMICPGTGSFSSLNYTGSFTTPMPYNPYAGYPSYYAPSYGYGYGAGAYLNFGFNLRGY